MTQQQQTEVTVEQVVALVQSNEEVRNALAGEFKAEITPDAFKAYLDTDAGKLAAQSYVDSKVSKGIEAWKNNNLQKHIDEALIAANPQETPEARQIRELTQKFEAQQKETELAKQKAYALNLAQQRNLPIGLIDNFVGATSEETLYKVNTYESEWKSALQSSVEALTGRTGRAHLPDNPNVGQSGTPERKLSDMSYLEKQNLYRTNPQEYARLNSLEG